MHPAERAPMPTDSWPRHNCRNVRQGKVHQAHGHLHDDETQWCRGLKADGTAMCAAPGCRAGSVSVFTAAADGRLGGQDWKTGDTIRLCPAHTADVFATQGITDPQQVAEWLRPDAADPPNTWRPNTTWTLA